MANNMKLQRRKENMSINLEVLKPRTIETYYDSNSHTQNKSEVELPISVITSKIEVSHLDSESIKEGNFYFYHCSQIKFKLDNFS